VGIGQDLSLGPIILAELSEAASDCGVRPCPVVKDERRSKVSHEVKGSKPSALWLSCVNSLIVTLPTADPENHRLA